MSSKRRKAPFEITADSEESPASSSKRVRFNPSGGSSAEDEIEFDHESQLESAKTRRGGIRNEGYESESSVSEDDSRKLKNGQGNNGAINEDEDDDDMFAAAPKPPILRGTGDDQDIAPQDIDLSDPEQEYDTLTGEPKIEPFNMRAEMEEGHFDDSGHYIRNKKDPQAFHDLWLEGVSRRDIQRAREAHEKKEREEREAQMAEKEMGRVEILQIMLRILRPRETVLTALGRLGKGSTAKTKATPRKPAYKKSMQEDMPQKEETEEELQRKKDIETLTDMSDRMMSKGNFDVYDMSYEQVVRELRLQGIIPDDWVPGEPLDQSSNKDVVAGNKDARETTSDAQWEYKWTQGEEVHGPFSSTEMKAWYDGGFFTDQSVQVRKLGESQYKNIEEVNF
ncbi:uncharacterized protein VTP21DRAFT_7380 [Calcarisporiella thermophila]|uniref:uncharacterized protein n=1 Tax=Calcarisporiella thermophila TaxID=911321 RepID=UPI0037438747